MNNICKKITGFPKLNFDYCFFFWIVLMMGNGTKFINNFDPRTNLCFFILLLIAILVLWSKVRMSKEKYKWYAVFVVLTPWIVYHYVVDTAFEYGSYAQFVLKIFVGMVFAAYYKERLIEYFYKIVSLLSFISIPFWVVCVFLGEKTLSTFAPFEQWLGEGSSFIVYSTLENLSHSDKYELVRNTGFCWEPGRFATCIVFAMACYIISNKGQIKWKSWRWLSMLTALVTTQSTTGYVTFLILIIVHYIFTANTSLTKKAMMLIIIGLSISSIMNLPFMQEKIVANADSNTWITERTDVQWVDDLDHAITVDRSEGIFLDYLNIQYKPIMGSGLSFKDTYLYKYISRNLTTSNGLTNPLSRLGLLIGIPFFILFFIGTKNISKFYSSSEIYLLFIAAMIMQYSYNFMFDIFFISLVFYSFNKKYSCVKMNGRTL